MGDYIRSDKEGLYRVRLNSGLGNYGFGDDGFGFGDWMSDLASKLPNPADAQQKAEQLGNQFTNWAQTQEAAVKKDAFKYFYLQGRDLIGKYVSDPRVAEFQKQADTLYDSATGMYNALDSLRKSKNELDASGIIDTTMAAQAMVTALASFAKYAGANAKVVDSFGGWASVGLGCMAGIAATHLMGMIGCASSIMMKTMESPPMQWYSILAESNHWPCVTAAGGTGQPKAFLAENVQNTAAIQADALRLAAVLKYYYGINSTADLWNRIKATIAGPTGNWCGWGDGGYPLPPPRDPTTGMFVPGSSSPATAVTLDDIAQIFAGSGYGSAHSSFQLGIPDRLNTRGQAYSEPVAWGRIIPTQKFNVVFSESGDVSVSIAESLAAAGRANLANHNTMTVGFHPLYGWVVVDELVNFFTAVTLQQITDDVAQAAAPIENAYLQSGLPVQLTIIQDAKTRWTMNATPVDTNVSALMPAVREGNVEACREFAGLRLMAALSHIIMMYRWGSTSTVPCDLIASIPMYAMGDLRRTLLAPIDPRTVIRTGEDTGVFNTADGINDGQKSAGFVVGKWRDTPTGSHLGAWRGPEKLADVIAGRELFFGPAKRAAREAAREDVFGGGGTQFKIGMQMQLTPQLGVLGTQQHMLSVLKSQMVLQMKTPAQAEQACIAGGGYFANGECKPSAAFEQACRDAGGTPTWNEDEKFRCPGSSLTIQQLGALSLKVGTQQIASGQSPIPGGSAPGGSGGGLGTIVLLAGAAWLFTKYLK